MHLQELPWTLICQITFTLAALAVFVKICGKVISRVVWDLVSFTIKWCILYTIVLWFGTPYTLLQQGIAHTYGVLEQYQRK